MAKYKIKNKAVKRDLKTLTKVADLLHKANQVELAAELSRVKSQYIQAMLPQNYAVSGKRVKLIMGYLDKDIVGRVLKETPLEYTVETSSLYNRLLTIKVTKSQIACAILDYDEHVN